MFRALATAAFVWFVAMTLAVVAAGTLDGPRWTFFLALVLPFIPAVWVFRGLRRADAAEGALQMGAVVLASGLRLVPGAGTSPATAIVCLERHPGAVVAAEHEYARTRVFTEPGRTWTVASQALQMEGGRPIDVLTFRSDDGQTREVFFDVSRSALFS